MLWVFYSACDYSDITTYNIGSFSFCFIEDVLNGFSEEWCITQYATTTKIPPIKVANNHIAGFTKIVGLTFLRKPKASL